jgi:hypothetical protein
MRLRTHLRPDDTRRTGNVIVLVAVSLVAMLSFAALSLDGGMMIDKRRQSHCAADAAALAAAGELYANWWKNGATEQGRDPGGTAQRAALAAAAANGFVDRVDGCTVEVNIPPKSGPFTNVPCHTEVIITKTQKRFFSNIFASGDITYGWRSVSRGRRGGINNAIICLDPYSKGALDAGGNGSIRVTGAPIQVNSTNSEGITTSGTNASMTADQFLVCGSPGYVGSQLTGTIVPNSPPIPDPLATLPYPDPSTLIVRETNGFQQSGNGQITTLLPGIYQGGITINGGSVILSPGIYYMDGGGFKVGGNALSVTGVGVLIFNAPQSNSDTISIQGTGTNVTLSPMMTGPYQGVLLFQTRSGPGSTAPVSVSGSSGGSLNITGTFYCANALLSVTGNGTQQTLGSQYISYDLKLGGNGTYNCTWTPDLTPGTREILLVE